MSADLGLDPSDPLNLLLNTSPNADDDDSAIPPQDWSKYSALWSDNVDPSLLMKPYSSASDVVDYTADLAMDMDFTPSIAIEPSALHQFDPMMMKFASQNLAFGYDDYASSLPPELQQQPGFNFSFSSAALTPNSSFSSASSSSDASPQSFSKERRLSVTSASSSSGASLSPVPESIPSPATGYASDVIQPKEETVQELPAATSSLLHDDPAAELAHRVRQSAGVMLAVPMNGQLSGLVNVANIPSQAKLPIPRLPRHNNSISNSRASPPSSSSSAASTPPPSTPPPASAISTTSIEGAAIQPNGAPAPNQPRPKTSHTTIERRYRTNLNARIQSLRMAVPALRVLEDREGGNGKKIKKNVKGGIMVKGAGIGIIDSEDGSVVDIIDDRGFVDGVKVARKCSKANVLGKAVEYIRVLKKREQRLKAEQAGLKALVQGLVGGPALIREWEKEWRAKFGGEEKDEVEGEDEEGDDEDSEDDDGEDDEEGGRKRKRPKVANPANGAGAKKAAEKKEKKATPSVVVVANEQGLTVAGAPEKRKRGRPRKVLPPPVTSTPVAGASHQDQTMHDQTMPMNTASYPAQQGWGQQAQPQQFLLAVFAVFSFLNSPLTSTFSSSSSAAHHHTGTVLVSNPPLAYSPEITSQFISTASTMSNDWEWKEYVQLFHLFVSLLVLVTFVANWFGLNLGLGMEKVAHRGRRLSVVGLRGASASRVRRAGGSSSASKADWVRLGEEMILEGLSSAYDYLETSTNYFLVDEASSLSLYERFRIYRATISRPSSSTSISSLVTLSLVMHNTTGLFSHFGKMKARSLWNQAKNLSERTVPTRKAQLHEKMVLESMDVDEAARRISMARAAGSNGDDESARSTPLQVLACQVVKERVRTHLATLFVEIVDGASSSSDDGEGDEKKTKEDEWRVTVDASKEMGGEVEAVGRAFERVWKLCISPSSAGLMGMVLDDAELGNEEEEDERDDETREGDVDAEIRALISAIVLYRRAFPGDGATDDVVVGGDETAAGAKEPLSPPPSPTPTIRATATGGGESGREAWLMKLRKALGNRVFESAVGGGLEDARDVVVDLIVDLERRERGAGQW
ncbi:hypothetical protein CVT24_006313 [Panaeolus cyanescens]|uniref:BHLH domain-containing protein n=1 Tax=Panaeolus cyanescens TaxID=181874 RepID=A0A409YEA8_9AGAR|nr:hypothetical protein CVT24_006313 [Panaeolus cyanescens]